MKRSSSQLKQIARQLLLGRYGTFIGATLIMFLITYALSIIPTFMIPGYTISSWVIAQLVFVIISLITAVLSAGLLQLSLNVSRNRPYSLGDLFYGFSNHPDRILIVGLLTLLISLVCYLPCIIYTIYLYNQRLQTWTPTLILMLLVLVGSIASYIVMLHFSLAIYLLLDNPAMSAIEAMTVSARLMKGHKGRFFYLNISFYGMILLGALSLGIGMLWLQPYMSLTITQFYRERIGELDPPPAPDYKFEPAPPVNLNKIPPEL